MVSYFLVEDIVLAPLPTSLINKNNKYSSVKEALSHQSNELSQYLNIKIESFKSITGSEDK
jgi:hypothetical protein